MIVYLDASALVKRYLHEAGSREVAGLFVPGVTLGTSVVTRAEVAAAIARAARLRMIRHDEHEAASRAFDAHWPSFVRLRLDEAIVSDAASLAGQHSLTGIDSIHLATALAWYAAIGEPVVMATYDNQLRDAAAEVGLSVWPES